MLLALMIAATVMLVACGSVVVTPSPVATSAATEFTQIEGTQRWSDPSGAEADEVGTDSVVDSTLSSGEFEVFGPCSRALVEGRDPCERRVPWEWPELKYPVMVVDIHVPDPPQTVRQEVDDSFDYWSLIPHVVVRGVIVPGSSRCSVHTGSIILRDNLEHETSWSPAYGSHINCFSEISVSEYIVGSGPRRVTAITGGRRYDNQSYDFGEVPRDEEYFADITEPLVESLEGYEWILWLEVPLDPATETWNVSMFRSVQRLPSGDIVAVSQFHETSLVGSEYEDRLDYPLDAYVAEMRNAMQYYRDLYGGKVADSADAPSLIASADHSDLREYLRSVGTYDLPGFTPTSPPPAPVPTDPPAGLGAELGASSQIELSWSAPSVAGVTSYKVVRRVPKGEFVTVVADTGSTETTYTDTSAPMTAGVTYIYRVLALNEYGESLASNRAAVELPGPDAPADFTATYRDGQVVLTWTQPGVIMPSCYRIYRRAQGEQSFEWVVNCWSADLRSWRDDDVVSGTRYIYRIVPMIGYTESGATARASIRVR